MCWDCYNNKVDPYKHFVQGGVEPEDFYEEVNYKNKRKSKSSPNQKVGCPENDNQGHVYIWTTEALDRDVFFDYYGFHKYEVKTCCGCGYRSPGWKNRRLSPEYTKRFKISGKFGYAENRDEGFYTYRRQQCQRGLYRGL